MSTGEYTLITQHGTDRKVRRQHFADFEAAENAARATTPDNDGMMVPSLDEPHASHPDYEQGFYWFGNKYAVIIRKGNRNRG